MKISQVLSLSLLALVSMQTTADAQSSCGARTRRDWDAMTSADKDTYKRAIESAMDSGEYAKFVEMHTEAQSTREAHGQCMFIYWHRLFLVAFENMLRGQGDEFACVTLPYFNWMVANNRMTTGECSKFGNCADIMTELGGWTSGSQQSVVINGDTVDGFCVDESPLNHYCQSSSVSGEECVHCVPRGDWSSVDIPDSTSYSSVRNQIFDGVNIGEMSPIVEGGCHNDVHSVLGSTMAQGVSPADPIFWSHHAMVDALHTIFHKCRVGTDRMTFEEKANNPVAWTSCRRQNSNGVFNPSDIVTMRTGENGVSPINGTTDPLIGKYFEGVPNRFADLMDVRDLGDSSYSFELSGQLANMYTQCNSSEVGTLPANSTTPSSLAPAESATRAPTTTAPASATPATTAPVSATPATTAPAPVTPVAATSTPTTSAPSDPSTMWTRWMNTPVGRSFLDAIWSHFNRDLKVADDSTPDAMKQQTDSTGSVSTKDTQQVEDDKVDVIIVDKCEVSEMRVMTWYDEVMTLMGGQSGENMADLERQSCMFHDQCLGGTQGYSEEFKATWHVKEPRCLTIVNDIKCGKQTIAYGAWREHMEAYFGCPNPAKETTSTSNDGMDQAQNAITSATDIVQDVAQTVGTGLQGGVAAVVDAVADAGIGANA